MAKDEKLLAAISLVSECNACHAECLKAGNATMTMALQAGDLLTRMKSNIKHGEWEGFVGQYLKFSLRSAQSYMKLHKGLGELPKSAIVALLKNEGSIKGMTEAVARANKPSSESNGKPKNSTPKRGTSKHKPAPKTNEPETVDAKSVTPTAEPCPNCGGTEWTEDESGIACASCSHPQGEPLGEDDKSIELPSWAISKPSVDAFRIAVNSLLKSLKDAPKTPGFELIHKHGARIRLDLENAKAALVGCVPHEYCPYCNGLANDCQPCSNRGWMNKVDYENTPKEVRREAEKLPSGGGR